jgi:hypothetical protein
VYRAIRKTDQRVAGAGAAVGAGNGDPASAGSAAAFGFFGFGRIGLRTFGGGPAGFSSANTGLGSIMVVAGLAKSPGFRITCTGTVTGWNFGSANVTAKPASGAGTLTEQGVLQPGPSEVVASAPGGVESSWTWTGGGVGLKESNENEENEEQPARLIPVTAIAMTRRMNGHSIAAIRHNPLFGTIEVRQLDRNRARQNR